MDDSENKQHPCSFIACQLNDCDGSTGAIDYKSGVHSTRYHCLLLNCCLYSVCRSSSTVAVRQTENAQQSNARRQPATLTFYLVFEALDLSHTHRVVFSSRHLASHGSSTVHHGRTPHSIPKRTCRHGWRHACLLSSSKGCARRDQSRPRQWQNESLRLLVSRQHG